MYSVISKYHSALNQTSVNKEKASVHKNLITAHYLSAKRLEDPAMKMYHFDCMLQAANSAIYYGKDHGLKWLANLIERGSDWDDFLNSLLED
jgi:hypothetical protein